jgi:hypothetical protein
MAQRYGNIGDLLLELKSKSDESRSVRKGEYFFFKDVPNDLADRKNTETMTTIVNEIPGGIVNIEIRYPSISMSESRSRKMTAILNYEKTPEGLVLRGFHSNEDKYTNYYGKIVQLSALRNAKRV